jgi:hypothetical protein
VRTNPTEQKNTALTNNSMGRHAAEQKVKKPVRLALRSDATFEYQKVVVLCILVENFKDLTEMQITHKYC